MQSNLLIKKIAQIQVEYKDLLKVLLPDLKTVAAPVAIDEINLFWLRYIDLVQLYLSYEFANRESYVFTASTFMDFEDKEHYPFLLFGKQHILDDPLSRYSDVYNNLQEIHISEKLLEQIEKTAEDNIKIIEGCNGHIFVLPLRLLNQIPKDSVFFKMGEQAFISLFNEINSIAEYFEKCNTFSDILKYARDDIAELVLFSEFDDKTLPFEQRYYQSKQENAYMIDDNLTEAYNFFIMVFSCIQQAVDVIVSCLEYKCIPFIRYTVALHYILLLEVSLSDIPFMPEMRYKMCLANLIYNICDKEKLSLSGFEKFTYALSTFLFDDKIFSSLSQVDINKHNVNIHVATPIVEKYLAELYDTISEL